MIKCNSCGKTSKDNLKFCSNCGVKMQMRVQDNNKKIPQKGFYWGFLVAYCVLLLLDIISLSESSVAWGIITFILFGLFIVSFVSIIYMLAKKYLKNSITLPVINIIIFISFMVQFYFLGLPAGTVILALGLFLLTGIAISLYNIWKE